MGNPGGEVGLVGENNDLNFGAVYFEMPVTSLSRYVKRTVDVQMWSGEERDGYGSYNQEVIGI